MPALVAFGRRWQLGSDDFVFGGLLDLLVRASCLIAACIIYWQHDARLSCPGGHNMRIYLVGNMCVLLGIIFTDIALIQNSMNGFIMDPEARKYVAPCLYLRLLLELPEVGWNIMGTIWAFSNASFIDCPEAPLAIVYMKGVIIGNWLLVISLLIVVAIFFDPLGDPNNSYEELDYERFDRGIFHHKHTRVWERRCKLLFCSCTGTDELSKNAFKEVGKIMSFLFEEVDLVPSDIAAGLVILHLKNQIAAESALHEVITKESNENLENDLTPGSPNTSYQNGNTAQLQLPIIREQPQSLELSIVVPNDPWNTPQIITHFMKYALGSYGWPWFLVANRNTGLCQLWENILCCGCCVSHPCQVDGDNCCYCHTSALKQTVKLEDSDLIYASFQNTLFCTPFFMAVDHSTKSIVLAIRGTLSLNDTITDLTAEAKSINVKDLPENCKAHNGMILTATHVLEKLNERQLLQKAKADYPNYNLVLAGHSLGAGTAAVLSIMLKPEYPNLHCYAYSPPGGLMTLEAATYCEPFTTSIVLGDDVVSRISVPAFEKFKKELQTTIRNCRAPKYRILVGGCFYLLMGGIPKRIISPEEAHAEGDRGSDTQLLQTSSEQNYCTYVSLAEESHRLHRESVTKCAMFPPGRILHVTERPIFRSRPDLVDGPRYEFRWAERTEFNKIIVTPKMMTDHYPDNVYAALRDISTAGPPNYVL